MLVDEKSEVDVVVVGAGPGGLGVLRELGRQGVRAVALERSPELAPTWRGAYDRLRLNTAAGLSHLPGRRIPRPAGRWPTREAFLAYLEDYAEGLDVRLGVEVHGLRLSEGGWLVDTSEGEIEVPQVVVATGYNGVPVVPEWPGSTQFAGPVLHSSAFRNGAAFRGLDVVVAGAGTSGAEIALDLAEHGARSVRLAVRSAPHVVGREVLGLPNQLLAIALRRAPSWLGDAVATVGSRLAVGDLRPLGLPAPPDGALTRLRRDGAVPVVDTGIVDALRRGTVEVVAGVAALDETGVVLADGRRVDAHAIVAATGYGPALERLVGDLGVLDDHGLPTAHGARIAPHAPGLRFVGFTNPISGNLREMRLDARRIGRAVARDLRTTAARGRARVAA